MATDREEGIAEMQARFHIRNAGHERHLGLSEGWAHRQPELQVSSSSSLPFRLSSAPSLNSVTASPIGLLLL